MDDGEEANADVMQRIQSTYGTSISSIPKNSLSINHLEIPNLSPNQIRAASRNFSNFGQHFNNAAAAEAPNKRVGIPPVSPYSQIPVSRSSNQQSFSPGLTHSRSLSQPNSFFSLDSLPPLSPVPDQFSTDVSMGDVDVASYSLLPPRVGESLPPRRSHRRSNSDVPFGFNAMMQSSSPVPLRGASGSDMGVPKPAQLVKKETSWERFGDGDGNGEGTGERKSEGELVDDLFSAYMNLDNIDLLNSADDKNNGNENHEDLDSRASGTKTNGGDSSDNETESSVNESGNSGARGEMNSIEKREGMKRSAGGDIAPTGRHYRSVSMDSFMGKLNLDDESPKFPPSPRMTPGKLSPSSSIERNSLEYGHGEFSGAELKKIMANEKLSEIATADPKRAKRILANRQSAARSKERKMLYISELEHKVQTLQTEATTLSAQLTLLQRDFVGLTTQNNELKFRLQAMDQQAKLRDALNEALTADVQRLKLATQELSGGSDPSKGMVSQQISANHQMFQLNIPHQFQQRQQLSAPAQPQQQNGNTSAKSESNHST